jgi:antirestriction protein ArdC
MAKNRIDVYELVTNRVISALSEGVIPWQQPWKSRDLMPKNVISGKPYRGINLFLLSMMPYESPYWLTFKQAKAKGATVRGGEKATPVIFWNMIKKKDDEAEDGFVTIPIARYYNVFNAEQVDGLELPETEENELFNAIEECENIMIDYSDAPEIAYDGIQASYSPVADRISIPAREQFDSAEGFYATLFHEAIHSTGHEDRLKRDLTKIHEGYSKEELVAEMGAAMLCGVGGIAPRTIDNQAAYIKNWLDTLHADKKLLIGAASKAQKASDYILGDA